MYPNEFRYTKEHEWVKVEGGEAVVGITDFAQKQLGDIIFVAVNGELGQAADLINKDPHGKGWIVRLRLADQASAGALMSASDYEKYLEGLEA